MDGFMCMFDLPNNSNSDNSNKRGPGLMMCVCLSLSLVYTSMASGYKSGGLVGRMDWLAGVSVLCTLSAPVTALRGRARIYYCVYVCIGNGVVVIEWRLFHCV